MAHPVQLARPVRGPRADREGEIAAMVVEAREWGERWLADDCSFCDVTLGLAALGDRLRTVERAPLPQVHRGRVLLSPMPGDQHGFGIGLVALRLREAGWEVMADVEPAIGSLVAAVRATSFCLIGLSVGHDRALARVAPLVRQLRAASRRPDLLLALGGPMLNGRAALARELGADLHADTAEALVAQLDLPMHQAA